MPTKVQNLERLKAKIAKLSRQTVAEIRPALDEAADELIAMQKRLAPVESGDLRNSIRKEPGDHDLAIKVAAGDDKKAFYARWVEFGTPVTPAQPFFFPAYRALKRRIKGKISKAVKTAARKAAG